MAYKDLVAMLKKGGAVFHYHNSDLTIFAKVKHFVSFLQIILGSWSDRITPQVAVSQL